MMLTEDMVKRDWSAAGDTAHFALAKIILRAHKSYTHVSAIVFGKKRIGKSVYALKVMKDIFQSFGLTSGEAWRYALASTIYRLQDFLELMRMLTKSDVVFPVVTIDDAGVGFSHLMRFSEEAKVLKGVFDTVGVLVSGIIYTTPNPKGLLNFIRDSGAIRIKILPRGGTLRQAWGVNAEITETGESLFTQDGAPVDTFDVRLPDEEYAEYKRVRRSYSAIAVADAIKTVLERTEGRKEEEEEEENEEEQTQEAQTT